MALISKASLLMVPSTYEQEKLYNVLPSGNRAPDSTDQNSGYDQTRADFSFDRGSNAAATRIGSDGLIKKYRENLLLQSNQFDTTWVNANSSETSGQADKDGGTNAWKIDLTGVSGRIYQSKSQSGVVTFSVYAKKGTLDWVILSSNIVDASFNLSTGEKGTLVAGITSSIEDVGGGWYRCSCTGSGAFTQFRVYPAIADNTFTGTSGNIYIQNAQAETSMVATDYLDSGATTAKAGVLIDLPRINYDANGENGALLLEPSRANNIAYSENVTNSWWLKSNVTALDNQGISPEGLNNAGKITLTSTGGAVLYRTSVTIGDGVLSFFANPGTLSGGRVRVSVDGVGAAYWNIDGTLSSVNGGTAEAAENYGNGWFRYSYNVPSGSVANYGVQGGVIGESMLVYGMQAEPNASYVSSYIPNHGESGGVTRAADSCSVTGVSDVIGQTEGTLFAEFKIPEKQTPSFFSISNGSAANRIIFGYYNGNLTYYVNSTTGSFTNTGIIDYSPVVGQTYKIALAYKSNDFKVYKNGTNTNTETTFTVPASLTAIDNQGGGVSQFIFAEVNQFMLFKERLSNAELATLTTL